MEASADANRAWLGADRTTCRAGRAQIEQFAKQAKAADQTALKKWLRDGFGSISYQVVSSSDLEKLNRRAHALQAALDALEQ